jgi:hypothetical protein
MKITQVKSISASEEPPPLLWDIRKAASRLSLSTVSVRRLIKRGLLSRHPGTRKVLISERALVEFASQA